MPHIPEPQYECFTCEQYFTRTSALMDGVPVEYATEYCTRACQQQFTEQLEAGAAMSKAEDWMRCNVLQLALLRSLALHRSMD